MGRSTAFGAVVFGILAAVAGYIWTAYEFPFAILLPAFAGWYLVCRRNSFSTKTSALVALIGGVGFTAVFLIAIFAGITDGSPFAISAWLSAVVAAVVAGAVTGGLLDGRQGAFSLGLFATAGMLVAVAIAGCLRRFAPASIDIAGPAQVAYFTLVIGIVGTVMGAAIGAGTSWVAESVSRDRSS